MMDKSPVLNSEFDVSLLAKTLAASCDNHWKFFALRLITKDNLPLVKVITDTIAIRILKSMPGATERAINRIVGDLAFVDHLRYSPTISNNVYRIFIKYKPLLLECPNY
jgi:hypothetical protein